MQISESLVNKLQHYALAEHPNECCGILAGKNNTIKQIYPVTNTYRSPYRYLMDPQEQFEAIRDAEKRGFDILGFYHSHTNSPAYPSATDVRMALQSGWLDVEYVLLSTIDQLKPVINSYIITEEGEITEVSINETP